MRTKGEERGQMVNKEGREGERESGQKEETARVRSALLSWMHRTDTSKRRCDGASVYAQLFALCIKRSVPRVWNTLKCLGERTLYKDGVS